MFPPSPSDEGSTAVMSLTVAVSVTVAAVLDVDDVQKRLAPVK